MFTLTTEFPACAGDQNRRALSAARLGLTQLRGMLSHRHLPRVLLQCESNIWLQAQPTWNSPGPDFLFDVQYYVSLINYSTTRNPFPVMTLHFPLNLHTAGCRSAHDTGD
jgi:hypothetical protein